MSIFHERQEGSLCAQHCLNALLQNSYYTAVDLAELASQLDADEQRHLRASNASAPASSNMDDTGFFSVQVLTKAIAIFSLELVPLQSPTALAVQQEPTLADAFICNLQEHWFTIRKIRGQWFNLNSLLDQPQAISDTYLALFLAQLQNEGHAIYHVQGQLPHCHADDQSQGQFLSEASRDHEDDDEDEELQRALMLSRNEGVGSVQVQTEPHDEDEELKRAIQMSLQQRVNESTTASTTATTSSVPPTSATIGSEGRRLGGSSSPSSSQSSSSAATLRARRQAFLDRLQKEEQSKKP